MCGESTPQAMRWVADQIRAKRFRARKVRGHWRMSDDDITFALEQCENGVQQAVVVEPTEPRVLSFSPTSARRRAS